MNKKILLVEDNRSDELLTLRAFKKANIANEIVVVRDGAEALDYLFGTGPYVGRDTSDLPTLTLLDMNLPRIDGAEVLSRLRADERTKYLPIVMLTASKEEADVIRTHSFGVNAYVCKPVDFGAFVEAVKTIGVFWLLLNEPPPSPHRARPGT